MRVLVNTKDITREEWLDIRRKSIGGSDAAAILGLSNYKSSFTLFYEKKGKLSDVEDDEAMRIGRDLEQYVADRFCKATGKKVRRRNQMFLHDDYDFISANIDRKVVGENAGLECKTTNAFTKMDFENGEIPQYYYCQCMHYMAVMGYDKVYLAVLVLGRAFYWFEIASNETEIDNLISAEVDFWKNHIEKDDPPTPDGTDSTSDTLRELYPDSTPENIFLFGFEDAADGYIQASRKEKEFKNLKEKYKNILLAEMQEFDTADLDGYSVSNKTQIRRTVDSKRLKAEQPDIYEKYINVSESKRFEVKEVKK